MAVCHGEKPVDETRTAFRAGWTSAQKPTIKRTIKWIEISQARNVAIGPYAGICVEIAVAKEIGLHCGNGTGQIGGERSAIEIFLHERARALVVETEIAKPAGGRPPFPGTHPGQRFRRWIA